MVIGKPDLYQIDQIGRSLSLRRMAGQPPAGDECRDRLPGRQYRCLKGHKPTLRALCPPRAGVAATDPCIASTASASDRHNARQLDRLGLSCYPRMDIGPVRSSFRTREKTEEDVGWFGTMGVCDMSVPYSGSGDSPRHARKRERGRPGKSPS